MTPEAEVYISSTLTNTYEAASNKPKYEVDLKRDSFGFFYYLTLITELGLIMASCILIGMGIGLFIDSKMRSAPFGLLVFLLLGILAAFVSAYQMIMKKIK